MITLDALNRSSPEAALEALGETFEHSPWVLEKVLAQRPWESLEAMGQTVTDTLFALAPEEQLALIRAHPDLAVKLEALERLTEHSQAEQRGAGFEALPSATLGDLRARLAQYRERLGHPFILCLKDHAAAAVLPLLTQRLHSEPAFERAECLRQISRIAWHRLQGSVTVTPPASSGVSTHVLDLYHGVPAEGMDWRFARLEGGTWRTLAEGATNRQGRTDQPLCATLGESGQYRLSFEVAAYFRTRGVSLPEPPFLDVVTLEVGMVAGQRYHLPLLVSPWAYSTYRGS